MKEDFSKAFLPYPVQFLTRSQKERISRNSEICSEYTKMRKTYPKLSRKKICECISQKMHCSFSCVYQILNQAQIW